MRGARHRDQLPYARALRPTRTRKATRLVYCILDAVPSSQRETPDAVLRYGCMASARYLNAGRKTDPEPDKAKLLCHSPGSTVYPVVDPHPRPGSTPSVMAASTSAGFIYG